MLEKHEQSPWDTDPAPVDSPEDKFNTVVVDQFYAMCDALANARELVAPISIRLSDTHPGGLVERADITTANSAEWVISQAKSLLDACALWKAEVVSDDAVDPLSQAWKQALMRRYWGGPDKRLSSSQSALD